MKKTIVKIGVIVLLVMAFFSFSFNVQNNIVVKQVRKYLDDIIIYNEAVPKISVATGDYDDAGSWNVDKSVKWLSKNKIEIKFDLNSILLGKNTDRDVILVLDTSNSMQGDKIDRLKRDSESLIEYLLSKENNRVGIISFNTSAAIYSPLTQNYDSLLSKVRNLTPYGRTNYNDALLKVDEVLDNYHKSENRDLIVLFLTDGYPDLGSPNQVATYNYLKNKYSYIKINGVQYEMGNTLATEIEEITDKQWIAKTTSLGNVLFAASEATEVYDYLLIDDYLNTDYFYIKDINDISASVGEISLEDNSKIKWDFGRDYFTTGSTATLKIKAYLKDAYIDVEGFYPTNKKAEFKSKLGSREEEITTKKTPVLTNKFKVVYDSNMPEGCANITYPEEEYFVFDSVNKKMDTLLCAGYLFGGWKIVEHDVDYINSDVFVMPQHDVMIRAEWKKAKIDKTMEGTVHSKLTLYRKIENDYNNGANDIGLYSGNGSDNYENNVYYYFGETENNNVYFADTCWKIVRTTETGGVKLLYNGKRSLENGCDGAANVIAYNGYNSSGNSLGYIGYMYNNETASKYSYKPKKLSEIYELLEVIYTNATDDFYYGDSIIYDGEKYILSDNVDHDLWKNNYNSAKGRYVCRNGSYECNEVYYVADIDPCDANSNGSNQYLLKLSAGQLLDDVNKTMYFSETVDDAGLVNPKAVSIIDWVSSNNSYLNNYSCSNVTDTVCTDKYYVISTTRYEFKYINTSHDYLYGNSFSYNDGVYTLSNTKHFWDWKSNYNTLGNNHYTCFNTSGVCDTLYYIIITSNSNNDYDALYVELKDGKDISKALDEMLFDQNVNTNDSTAKRNVDNWYKANILDTGYSLALEDTIYCNDRRIGDFGNWNPNNSNTSWGLYYSTYLNRNNAADLTCYNKMDQFTTNSVNGNGALRYPVGLLTAPEVYLASNGNNSNSYIKATGTNFTMSPSTFYINNQSAIALKANGTYNTNALLWYGYGVRPVVSLKENIEYLTGDGSSTNPYIIQKINE